MKVAVCYSPLEGSPGVPLLGQNRQFQWFSDPTYIYPMVPASAATLLSEAGHDVLWLDGIAEGLSYAEFLRKLELFGPQLVVMETKTPVVKKHWRIAADIKRKVKPVPYIAMVGDHVTALPLETMENSRTDFVLTGGDYDFLLKNLVESLSGASRLDQSLEPGVWYKQGDRIRNTGLFRLDHDLNSLPLIDRDLTKWKLYSRKNGNYKYRPGTYTMAARDCWWGRCTFCAWTVLYPGDQWRARSPENLLAEVDMLVKRYGVREIMDDSGTFPRGNWLRQFCQGMIETGTNKKVAFSCNMRFGALQPADWHLMKKAGFRFVLFGLESVNDSSLKRINKNLSVERVAGDLALAKQAGLEPHITVMVGYPWETREETARTLAFARSLFDRGLTDTLQATVVVPYPGTPLFEECRGAGLLKTTDWQRYDMREAVMSSPMSTAELQALTQELYKAFVTPRFVLRKILGIRGLGDIAYLARAGKAVAGHLRDFMRSPDKPSSKTGDTL